MGRVIALAERRERRRRARAAAAPGAPARAAATAAATFHFDLTSPFTYLAAERLERVLPGAVWAPARGEVFGRSDRSTLRAEAERRSFELRMPLVWPDPGPRARGKGAMRAASYAAERGRAPAFVLAASRLAFCGGFALDDPEVIAEASAAAGLPLAACLRAARDGARDRWLYAAARRLRAAGATGLPCLEVGDLLFCGERRLPEAAAAARLQAPASGLA